MGDPDTSSDGVISATTETSEDRFGAGFFGQRYYKTYKTITRTPTMRTMSWRNYGQGGLPSWPRRAPWPMAPALAGSVFPSARAMRDPASWEIRAYGLMGVEHLGGLGPSGTQPPGPQFMRPTFPLDWDPSGFPQFRIDVLEDWSMDITYSTLFRCPPDSSVSDWFHPDALIVGSGIALSAGPEILPSGYALQPFSVMQNTTFMPPVGLGWPSRRLTAGLAPFLGGMAIIDGETSELWLQVRTVRWINRFFSSPSTFSWAGAGDYDLAFGPAPTLSAEISIVWYGPDDAPVGSPTVWATRSVPDIGASGGIEQYRGGTEFDSASWPSWPSGACGAELSVSMIRSTAGTGADAGWFNPNGMAWTPIFPVLGSLAATNTEIRGGRHGRQIPSIWYKV